MENQVAVNPSIGPGELLRDLRMNVSDEVHDSQEMDIDSNQNSETGAMPSVSGVVRSSPVVLNQVYVENFLAQTREAEAEPEDEDDDEDELFQRKQKKESSVWKYGTRLKDGSNRCNLCGKIYKAKQGNTTNLINHIKTKHRGSEASTDLTRAMEEAKEAKKQKLSKKVDGKKQQSSMLSFVRRSGTMDKKKKERITESIADFIIEDTNNFEVAEKPSFRKLIFTCEPNYIVPSRRTITRKIDEKAEHCKELLKKEILKDLEQAGHKTVSITCDEGTSSDRFKTKKLAVTIHRTSSEFEVKSDTLAIDTAYGSQSAAKIRSEVKDVLVRYGYDSSWTVNWTTDGPSVMLSARARDRHDEVGLKTNHTGTCTDHSMHLVVEEASEKVLEFKASLFKVRKLVEYFKQSSLARQKLHKIQIDNGIAPLSVVQGTDNRWYFKYSEVLRIVELRSSIKAFQDMYYEDLPERLDLIEEGDWPLLVSYVKAVSPFVKATEMFSGENYITSSRVIPVFDQMTNDLSTLCSSVDTDRDVKNLASNLLQGLRRRFPFNYQNLAPYNILTFLDPRFVDLYADTEDLMETVTNDIINDSCYDMLGLDADVAPEPPQSASGSSSSTASVSDRRSQLLQRKMTMQQASGSGSNQDGRVLTLKEKIKREIVR